MKSFKHIISCAALAASLSAFQTATAQSITEGGAPVIIAPSVQTTSYLERTLCYDITANVDYTVASKADWISVRKGTDGTVYVHVQRNTESYERTGTVTFANEEKNLSYDLTITQSRDESASDVDTKDESIYALFTDKSMSELKEGVTKEQIEAIDNDFIATLAEKLYDGTYNKDYRVADYKAYLSYVTQSNLWNAPGKYYDQRAGVTGINISKGKNAIAVSGLGDGETLPLTLTAWWVNKYGTNFDGGNPSHQSFTLKNGLNIIDYTGDYDALAYICYYADNNPELKPVVKVHFINAQVNGYLSPDKSNAEMDSIVNNAPNQCIDLVGNKAHCVWEAKEGLAKYCKATDGTSLGYRQYMNVMDSIVQWEHDLLGFKKYNSEPDNRTMAYVNYTYYMFQGGFGVSFIHSQQWRVLNCKTLCYNDDDAIWGLSHEWGHQHQMHPYFCWAGLGEVSNNMNSYYNIMKMGYYKSDKINNWSAARKHFVQNDYSDVAISDGSSQYGSSTGEAGSLISTMRHNAFANRGNMSNAALRAVLEADSDSTVTYATQDPLHALAINEVNVGELLCPFIMLQNYFAYYPAKKADLYPDFIQDFYEALRQTDATTGGSVIEKQDGFDKYELLAAAQNSNKNGLYETFKKKYPKSCWNTKGYVDENSNKNQNSVPFILNFIRKASRLTGYNLFPYFETWGFLRQTSLYIGDYGNYFYIMESDMYDEFKTDMEALGLKTLSTSMVQNISNTRDLNRSASDKTFETPEFPN